MAESAAFHPIEAKLLELASPGIKPGLARLSHLLSLLGDPQRKFKAVHIVGTNGKGSVASTLSSILGSAGCSPALYTSPHLVSFGERLAIGGIEVPPEKWLGATKLIADAIQKSERLKSAPPTYFELVTAAAFIIISESSADVAVIEAGLGGRLDATNILSAVILTLITPIGIDHSEFLGGSIDRIAEEKFAVMRPGVPAIFAGGDEKTEGLFFRTAFKKKTPAQLLRRLCSYDSDDISLAGTNFFIESECLHTDYHTPLIGVHQTENAALAIMASLALKATYHSFSEKITMESIKAGVSSVRWPGRLELLKEAPLLIIDGAHNVHAMNKLVETLGILLPDGKYNIVLAMMKDKDASECLELIKRTGMRLFCTQVPDMERSLSSEELYRAAAEKGINCAGEWTDPMTAVKRSLADGTDTICCGSLFLCGLIKERQNEF